MDYNLVYLFGNVLADLSIAIVALILWLHEREEKKFRILTAILLSEKSLSNSQLVIIEAWAFAGKESELEAYTNKCGMASEDREKLKKIAKNLRNIRSSMVLILGLFSVGIFIEAIALGIGLGTTNCNPAGF